MGASIELASLSLHRQSDSSEIHSQCQSLVYGSLGESCEPASLSLPRLSRMGSPSFVGTGAADTATAAMKRARRAKRMLMKAGLKLKEQDCVWSVTVREG